MKVKLFDCDHELDLEDEINSFIEDKEIVDIKYSVAITSLCEEQIYCYTALIVYIDK